MSISNSSDSDPFRDTSIRYLGYANEVGESFRPIFPRLVIPSYGIAFAYVGADAIHKSLKARNNGSDRSTIIRIGTDALLWQTLASVLIPGKVIQIITSSAVHVFQSDTKIVKSLSKSVRTWSPTVIGLTTIPFIIHPIDNAVDYLFEHSIRKWWL